MTDEERREKKRAYNREFRRKHPHYHAEHPEWQARWRAKNPEKVAGYQRKKYLADPQRVVQRVKEWRAKNSDYHQVAARHRHAKSVAKKLGFTSEQWEVLASRLDGPCEICGGMKPMRIDHDHATGKFRGLLCQKCNLGMGFLGDSREGLERALSYLEKVLKG